MNHKMLAVAEKFLKTVKLGVAQTDREAELEDKFESALAKRVDNYDAGYEPLEYEPVTVRRTDEKSLSQEEDFYTNHISNLLIEIKAACDDWADDEDLRECMRRICDLMNDDRTKKAMRRMRY